MVSSISRILAAATATLWIGQKQSSSSSSSSLSSVPSSSSFRSLQAGRSSFITIMRFFVVKTLVCFVVGSVSFIALYYAICSPPLHLFYDVAPSAGPSSVYLPVRTVFVIIYLTQYDLSRRLESLSLIICFARPLSFYRCHVASSPSSRRRRVQAFRDFGFILGI
jgi:hypothetical protein